MKSQNRLRFHLRVMNVGQWDDLNDVVIPEETEKLIGDIDEVKSYINGRSLIFDKVVTYDGDMALMEFYQIAYIFEHVVGETLFILDYKGDEEGYVYQIPGLEETSESKLSEKTVSVEIEDIEAWMKSCVKSLPSSVVSKIRSFFGEDPAPLLYGPWSYDNEIQLRHNVFSKAELNEITDIAEINKKRIESIIERRSLPGNFAEEIIVLAGKIAVSDTGKANESETSLLKALLPDCDTGKYVAKIEEGIGQNDKDLLENIMDEGIGLEASILDMVFCFIYADGECDKREEAALSDVINPTLSEKMGMLQILIASGAPGLTPEIDYASFVSGLDNSIPAYMSCKTNLTDTWQDYGCKSNNESDNERLEELLRKNGGIQKLKVVGKNGRMNGLFAAQVLLGKDIFFFNDGEIVYDGENHKITGMQLNAAIIDNYPSVPENAQTFCSALSECMAYVEENELLKCDLFEIDEELHQFIFYENLTGMTLMHLFAWHLLMIADGDIIADAVEETTGTDVDKADYTVFVDTRLLNGIPDCCEKTEELIHTLLRYSGDDGDVVVNCVGIRNFDVGYDDDEDENEYDEDENEYDEDEDEYDEDENEYDEDEDEYDEDEDEYDEDEDEYDEDEDEYDEDEDEYDDDDDDEIDEEEIDKLTGALDELIYSLSALTGTESGIGERSGKIKGTDFDMFNMTFTSNNRVYSDNWSIAIPDGYVQVKSEDDRPFELVPKGYEENPFLSPIRLLPSNEQGGVDEEMWFAHPNARDGYFRMYAAETGKQIAQTGIFAGDILIYSKVWDDIGGYIYCIDTTGSSYSYNIVIHSDYTGRQLRVQTNHGISEEQRDIIAESILKWMTTFRFTKRNNSIKRIIADSTRIITELENDNLKTFKSAIEQAKKEYIVSHSGGVALAQYYANNISCEIEYIKKIVTDALEKALETKLFYAKKLDNVLETAEKNDYIDEQTIDNMYNLLAKISEGVPVISLPDGQDICVEMPEELSNILDRWNSRTSAKSTNASSEEDNSVKKKSDKKASKASGNDAQLAKMKRMLDRQKRLVEWQKKSDEETKKDIAEIKSTMDSIVADGEKTAAVFKKRFLNVRTDDNFFEDFVDQECVYMNRITEILEHRLDTMKETIEEIRYIDDFDEKGLQTLCTSDMFDKLADAMIDVINRTYKLWNTLAYADYAFDGYTFNQDCGWEFDLYDAQKNLEEYKGIYRKYRSEIEVNAEEYEKNRSDYDFAVCHNVALSDVATHRTYVNACELMANANDSETFSEAEKHFGRIKGYLDSDEQKERCGKLSKNAKALEKLKLEYENEANVLKQLTNEQKALAEQLESAKAELSEIEAALGEKRSSYNDDKKQLEDIYNSRISKAEETLDKCEDEATKTRRLIEDYKAQLEKTFALALGKKKDLRYAIESNEKSLAKLESDVSDCKKDIAENKGELAKKLRQLDEAVSSLESKVADSKQFISTATARLEALKVEIETATTKTETAKSRMVEEKNRMLKEV